MAAQSTPQAAPIQPPQRRTDELLATLAERIGARFDAGTVFGAPVDRDGVTVIPVAAIRFGMGGGGGSDPSRARAARAAVAAAAPAPRATSRSRRAAPASSRSCTPRACSCSSAR
jgi:hypothetical protein